MAKTLSETDLFYLQASEAKFLLSETDEYFKHGIEIQPQDTIFDVGANIGVFSLLAAQRCSNQLQVYAFKPIPAIFKVLRQNVDRFQLNVKLFQCGLSQSTDTKAFTVVP